MASVINNSNNKIEKTSSIQNSSMSKKEVEEGLETPSSKPIYYNNLLSALSSSIDYEQSKILSSQARRVGKRRNKKGHCLRYFRVAFTNFKRAFFKKKLDLISFHGLSKDPSTKSIKRKKRLREKSPGKSAEDFRKWALKNPISMCQELGLADVTDLKDAYPEPGFVHIYNKGKCGFHKRYGHIEVLTNFEKKVACSDHCRTVNTECQPDVILAPVSSCDWLIVKTEKFKTNSMIAKISDTVPFFN